MLVGDVGRRLDGGDHHADARAARGRRPPHLGDSLGRARAGSTTRSGPRSRPPWSRTSGIRSAPAASTSCCERAKETGAIDDPVVRQEIAKLLIMAKSAEWTARRARAAQKQGKPQGPEGSLGQAGRQPRRAAGRAGAHADHRGGRDADRRGRPDERGRSRRFWCRCRPARSPAAPTRSSATSSPSGSWGCRARPASTPTSPSRTCRGTSYRHRKLECYRTKCYSSCVTLNTHCVFSRPSPLLDSPLQEEHRQFRSA